MHVRGMGGHSSGRNCSDSFFKTCLQDERFLNPMLPRMRKWWEEFGAWCGEEALGQTRAREWRSEARWGKAQVMKEVSEFDFAH